MAGYGAGGWSFRPGLSLADKEGASAQGDRQDRLERQEARTGRRAGRDPAPRAGIATTSWGKAWCDNLERYLDCANRLPRGRTYVRNGSLVDLAIARGKVEALVAGSAS